MTFGTGAKFPAKYQKAFYVLDWSYGRLIAVHLTPKGSSYTATFENFVAPPRGSRATGRRRRCTLTDVVIGDDGALYFTTGGRNTQSGLYRVTYTGSESTAAADLHDEAGAKDRQLRHELEAFHGKKDRQGARRRLAAPEQRRPLPALRRPDRGGVPARGRVEGAGRWPKSSRTAALTALLALARYGAREDQPDLLAALDRFPLGLADRRPAAGKAARPPAELHPPGPAGRLPTARRVARRAGRRIFPNKSEMLNRELAQLLIYLQAPRVAEKCSEADGGGQDAGGPCSTTSSTCGRCPSACWTMDQRKEYFGYFTKDRKKLPHPPELVQWFADAGRPLRRRRQLPNFMKNFFKEATANLSDAERKELAPLLKSIDQASVSTYETKPRPVVKAWKMDELLPMLDKRRQGPQLRQGAGRRTSIGQCIKCHRFGNEGGAVGPDLTAVSSRFARRDILESILEPSKVVSEQYQNVVVTTTTGKTIVGRL